MLAGLALLSASCNKEILRGEGTTGSMLFGLAPFTGVETSQGIQTVIRYGNTREIKATGYQNLLNELDPRVENGILKLRYNNRYHRIQNGNLVVYITVPEMNEAALTGSSDLCTTRFASLSHLQDGAGQQ